MNLRKQTISGVKWTTLSTVTLAMVGLIKIAILARFLDTGDFGLMALVSFVLGFTNLFMDMGLTSAILHKQNISENEYASLYWINVVFSFVLFGILSFIGPIIADFYKEPELSVLIPIMAICIIFSALGNQFKTIEQKSLNFKYIAIAEIIGGVTSMVVGIVLAIMGYGVYSLVYAALTQYSISNAIYFIKGMNERGLLLHFRYEETKPFLRIGIYQVGGQMVNYFNRDIDILLIGKFFGSEVLGGYSLAKQLVRKPIAIINPIINRVGMAVFPRFQHDHHRLRSYFLRLFNAIGSLNAMVYGCIAICAYWLVLLLYGSDFLHIVPYVQLFTLVTYLRLLAGNVGILVITTGRTDYEFYWNLITLIVTPATIYFGALYSVEVIILSLGVMQLVFLIPSWYMFFYKLINMRFWPFMKAHLYPLIIASLIFLISYLTTDVNLVSQFFFASFLIISLLVYSYMTVPEFQSILKKHFKNYAWF